MNTHLKLLKLFLQFFEISFNLELLKELQSVHYLFKLTYAHYWLAFSRGCFNIFPLAIMYGRYTVKESQ